MTTKQNFGDIWRLSCNHKANPHFQEKPSNKPLHGSCVHGYLFKLVFASWLTH